MQTKQRLSNSDAQGVVQRMVNEHLGEWLRANPEACKSICQKAVQAARARVAAQVARTRVREQGDTPFSSVSGVSKLADCQLKDPEKTELFVVEGK